MDFHVTPINDLEEHEESSTCKCKPRLLFEEGYMIFMHNSFDGREAVEWANEILTNY